MKAKTKSILRLVILCAASLGSSILFCLGCSIHETNRWGQSQDAVTHLLAGGTYLSLLILGLSIVSLVIFAVTKSD